MDVLYFAWVRERIGLPREQIETAAATVMDLVEELRAREERYALAFSDLSSLPTDDRGLRCIFRFSRRPLIWVLYRPILRAVTQTWARS